jgi:hypothetical protein
MAIPNQELRGATKAAAVTASDDTDLTGVRALYIGTAGTLVVRLIDDPSTTVTFGAVTAGSLIPLQVTRVMAATGATNIVALY